MIEQYRTIKENAVSESIEKKSKFIARIYRVETPEEAEAYLQQIRKKYWDATHHCYAYQIGERDEIQRFSDDGEPQGTAGKPILDVLKGKAIKNTLIIVTRYFGGTLLGTGGLVRAYGHAAKQAVEVAGLVEKQTVRLFRLEMSYPLSGKVQYLLNERNYTIRETDYTDKVTFIVEVLKANETAFCDWLVDETNAEIIIEKGPLDRIETPIE